MAGVFSDPYLDKQLSTDQGGVMGWLKSLVQPPQNYTPLSQMTPDQLGMNNAQKFNDQMQSMHPMDKAALATSSIPIAGDLIGLAADARMFAQEPEQRNMMNYGLAGLGALPFIPSLGMIKAYHGTPHKVDKFSMDKIGTGEGAQAYGHGLYFADSPDVAKGYRDALSDGTGDVRYTVNGNSYERGSPEWKALGTLENDGKREANKLLKSYKEDLAKNSPYIDEIGGKDFVDRFEAIIKENPKDVQKELGNLYNVNIDVEPEDLLDWDAPFDKQPKQIQDALKPLYEKRKAKFSDADKLTGEDWYGMLYDTVDDSGQHQASQYLKDKGIPGIQYYDGMSRDAAKGTRNYVMFDENLIDIQK